MSDIESFTSNTRKDVPRSGSGGNRLRNALTRKNTSGNVSVPAATPAPGAWENLSFDKYGRVLNAEEREKVAKARGLCVTCGGRTHKISRHLHITHPLNNEYVSNGICLICNPSKNAVSGSSHATADFRNAASTPVAGSVVHRPPLLNNCDSDTIDKPRAARRAALAAPPSTMAASSSRVRFKPTETIMRQDDESDNDSLDGASHSFLRQNNEKDEMIRGLSNLSLLESLRTAGIDDPEEFLRQTTLSDVPVHVRTTKEFMSPGHAVSKDVEYESDGESSLGSYISSGGKEENRETVQNSIDYNASLVENLLMSGINPEDFFRESKNDASQQSFAAPSIAMEAVVERGDEQEEEEVIVSPQCFHALIDGVDNSGDRSNTRRNNDNNSAGDINNGYRPTPIAPKRRQARKKKHTAEITKSLKESLALCGFDPDDFIRESEENAAKEDQEREGGLRQF